MVQDRLIEMAFDWVKDNTVKAVFKTAGITIHGEDIPRTGDARRIYTVEEIQKVLSNIKGREVGIGIGHKGEVIPNTRLLVAGWNESIQGIEGLLQLPEGLIKDIREGKYKYVSWDVIPKDMEKTSEGIVYKELYLDRIDLVPPGANPGDPNCEIQLLETEGKYITEIQIDNGPDEPFAGYTNWDDCIAKNQDKDNPESFCGILQAKTKDKPLKEGWITKDGQHILIPDDGEEPSGDGKEPSDKIITKTITKGSNKIELKLNSKYHVDTDLIGINESRVAGIKEIEINDGSAEGYPGLWDEDKSKISIDPTVKPLGSTTSLKATFDHEVGHAIYSKGMTKEERSIFSGLVDEEGVYGKYAKTNIYEAFAEQYTSCNNRTDFARSYPKQNAFFNKILRSPRIGESKSITDIKLTEPMAQFTDWDDCITWAGAQPDIDDPEAYCGYIKAQTESGRSKEEIIESLKTMTWKSKLTEAQVKEIETKDKRIQELEESMNNIVKANEDIKKNQETRIREAMREGNLDIIKELEKVTPGGWSYSKWTLSARRYREDIARILWKKKEELQDGKEK